MVDFFLGFELACIQCTSSIQPVQEKTWDNSCLDGTLRPLPCKQQGNASMEPFKNCVSALYRLSLQQKGGKKNDDLSLYKRKNN
jgi:hypothetical protein